MSVSWRGEVGKGTEFKHTMALQPADSRDGAKQDGRYAVDVIMEDEFSPSLPVHWAVCGIPTRPGYPSKHSLMCTPLSILLLGGLRCHCWEQACSFSGFPLFAWPQARAFNHVAAFTKAYAGCTTDTSADGISPSIEGPKIELIRH